ncbi:uncharacterized protein LOC111012397 [Momordica charantia]|uniref:Uncharacterized protein LOC111012397 n=1 Tax=Momordica charantia TaxID=3673 RepID=A0A6J1CKC0_MOMCH|nr:uncharacterized protein LOC111012397 [Momordica charantia]
MPSGAKKRKAAKKKKELGAHINPSSNTSQGNDDVKSQDDKGSDSGELDSPASQNHPSHSNPFGEGNKEIQESSSSSSRVLSNIETNQKVGLASESKNGTVQNESVEGSCANDRSSSSSSDDESVDTTKNSEVLDGKTNDLVVPTAASIVYSVTPEVSASEETISIVESASVENTAIPDIIASEKLGTRLPEVTNVPVSAPTDLSLKQDEDRDLHLSVHIEVSECPENFKPESEDQPFIGSRPAVPQRTSWWSCCGLCDVFTGSNR